MSIRFSEEDVRSMGRPATGVRGINLEKDDAVVAAAVVVSDATLLVAGEHGIGKRTSFEEYRKQSRGGKGIITMKTTDRTGRVVGVQLVTADDQLMIITNAGKIIRLRIGDIRVIGRNTQGVRLIELEEDERVVSVARLAEKEEEDEEGKGDQ